MSTVHITIVGAGVVGLTNALVLSRNPRYKVLVVADFMPGDYDIGYASPWAGANWFPMGPAGTLQAQLEARTWPVLKHLAQNVPEACIQFQDAVLYTREEDAGNVALPFANPGEEVWFKDLVENYSVLPPSALPEGIASGYKYTSVCINTALYLPYLVGQCRKQGVAFHRARLSDISEAYSIRHADGEAPKIVVTAIGLGARTLKGIEDPDMVPARGQVTVVRNEPGIMMGVSAGKKGDNIGYTMSRPGGGGTIVGGCYQLGNFESQVDPNLATKMMANAIKYNPALVKPGEGVEALSIIRQGVGLRPVRTSGVRIEKEKKDSKSPWIVHCYGHGGWGYQTSYGSAAKVQELVNEIAAPTAKL